MRNSLIVVVLSVFLLGIFQTCKRRDTPANTNTDSDTSGTVQFVSDESFAPILDQELYVFKSTYPSTHPEIIYRSEDNVLKLLMSDSVNFAFLSRNLSPAEFKTLADHNLPARVTKFASDAITIIVNQASTDTTISVSEIKKMLVGRAKTDKNIVFDNPNSSLVRYLKDFTGQKELKQKNIYALKSNKEVIRYVSQNPNAIGITGFSWLDDPDADYADAVKKIKIVAVKDDESKTSTDQYYKPSQTTLSLNQYPMKRDLFIVNCIGSRKGLGAAFERFIVTEKGQRIILRSGLLPVKVPPREIVTHSKL